MVRIPDGSPVRRWGWLSTLPSEFAETVLSRSDVIHRGAGEALYQVGDEGTALFGVLEGRVEIHVHPLGDTPTLTFIVGPGFWTGEMATLANRPRIISLVARSECRLLRMSRAELLRITQASPEAWRHISLLILGNLATAMALLGAVRCVDPVQRVALVLTILAEQPSERAGFVDILQPEIGAMARMSRSSVNAALAALEQAGLVRRAYRGLELPDAPALAAFAQRG